MIPETPPSSSQAELEAENAQLRKKLRRHRRHSRQRRNRDDSEDDSSGSSDEEVKRKVSFKDQYNAGNKPFLALYDIYPAVNIKYFKQIYWGTFQPNQSMRLARDELNGNPTHKGKKDDETTPEEANMV